MGIPGGLGLEQTAFLIADLLKLLWYILRPARCCL